MCNKSITSSSASTEKPYGTNPTAYCSLCLVILQHHITLWYVITLLVEGNIPANHCRYPKTRGVENHGHRPFVWHRSFCHNAIDRQTEFLRQDRTSHVTKTTDKNNDVLLYLLTGY